MADEKTKGIAELTDEEIAGMSDEELQAALDADSAAANAPDAEEGDEEEDGGEGDDDAGGEEEEEGDGDGGEEGADDGEEEGEGEDGQPAPTKEQLEALAGEEDDDDKSDMVPRARLNEVLESNRDLRTILRTVVADKQPAPEPAAEEPKRPEYDFKAANREYHKLLTEGEEEKALAKLDEIEDKRAELHAFDVALARREAEDRAYSRTAADQSKREMDAVAEEMVKRYPFLDNTNAAEANEAAILAVNAKAKQLVAKGKAPAAALHEAATKIGAEFAKVLAKPAKQGENGKDGKSKKPVKAGEDPRSQEALKRNLGVRQPPVTKTGVGTREQLRTLDIANMTDEQIDKLSPEELADARGDTRIG